MTLPWSIAIRFVNNNRWQSIAIALGIAVGVSVQVFIGALISGLQQGLIEKTVGNSPHIVIKEKVNSENTSKGIAGWKELSDVIRRADPGVEAVSAGVESPAFVIAGKNALPVLLRGLTEDGAQAIYQLPNKVFRGEWPTPASGGVLVGRELAEERQLALGDRISVRIPSGELKSLEVTGLFDLGIASLNKSWIVSSLESTQSLLGLTGRLTSIEVRVDDVFAADVISDVVADAIDASRFSVENWKAQNEQLLSGLKGQSISSGIIQVCVLLAVVLGIASILAMTVMQKSRQLGILKAMGLRDIDASLIFMLQGLILGVAGTVLGIFFGAGLGIGFTTFAVNPDGTPVAKLAFSPEFLATSAIAAILSSALASLIPAQKSRRLTPMEVIRNG